MNAARDISTSRQLTPNVHSSVHVCDSSVPSSEHMALRISMQTLLYSGGPNSDAFAPAKRRRLRAGTTFQCIVTGSRSLPHHSKLLRSDLKISDCIGEVRAKIFQNLLRQFQLLLQHLSHWRLITNAKLPGPSVAGSE